MPLWTVLRGCASGASGLWPLASCEVNCQVSSSSIASGQNRDPTREMPDDVPEGFLVGLAHVRLLPAPMARRFVASGRSRACGKICRSALSICIAPPNADLATRLSPRVPKGHLAHAASRAGRDKRWFPPAEYGWEEGGPAEPAHETRLPPPRRTGPQGSVRCRFPAGGHVVLERAMHERVRSRRMDRLPVEVADTRIRASVRDGDVELAGKLLGRSYEIAAGRRHRPTRGVQPGRPLLLSRRTAVLSS